MIREVKNLDNWILIYFKFYLMFKNIIFFIIEVIINYVYIDNIKLLVL